MNKKMLLIWFVFTLLSVLSLILGSELLTADQIVKAFEDGFVNTHFSPIRTIIFQIRLPKMLAGMLAGMAVSTAGLMMQTLFKNPMAGPYVLGVQSGASLGVAFLIMSGIGSQIGGFFQGWLIVLSAAIGSFIVLSVVLIVSAKIKQTASLLIIGLLFGTAVSSFVSLLSYFTDAQSLRTYLFWSFGSLGGLNWEKLLILFIIIFIALLIIYRLRLILNLMLLGDVYASSMGIDIKDTRRLIIIATALLAGGVTAFVGPVGFLGLAVPHLTRMTFQKANHQQILLPNALIGSCLLLLCDIIAQVPGSAVVLPLNAITALLGWPIVIWLFFGKSKLAATFGV